jgi:hypothetical protein
MNADDDDATEPATVGVLFNRGEMAALDAWIAGQDIPFTRAEAIRAIVAATLQLMETRG